MIKKQTLVELKVLASTVVGKDNIKEESVKLGKTVPELTKDDYTKILTMYQEPTLTFEEASEASDEFNNIRDMYIVTDHDTTMTTEEEVTGGLFPFSYANKVISREGTVRLDGEPQYLSKATVRHLSTLQSPSANKKAGTDEPDNTLGNLRFKITPVDNLSEAEVDTLRRKQKTNSI